MRFYYTVSSEPNAFQEDPAKSLGGYESSVEVQNDTFSNLFDEISLYTIQQNRDEYIALILKNELGEDAVNVNLLIEESDTSYSKLEVALVSLAVDNEGQLAMERVRTKYSRPFNGDFLDASLPLFIGNMPSNSMIGVWIKRSLLLDRIAEYQENGLYEKDPDNNNLYKEIEPETEDSFSINVSWDSEG